MRRSISRRQHEQILAAAHLRHQEELAQVQAKATALEGRLKIVTEDRDRAKGERDQFAKDRDTHRAEAEAARALLAACNHQHTTHSPGDDRKAIDAWERQLAARQAV